MQFLLKILSSWSLECIAATKKIHLKFQHQDKSTALPRTNLHPFKFADSSLTAAIVSSPTSPVRSKGTFSVSSRLKRRPNYKKADTVQGEAVGTNVTRFLSLFPFLNTYFVDRSYGAEVVRAEERLGASATGSNLQDRKRTY